MQANYARLEHRERDLDLGRGSVGQLGARSFFRGFLKRAGEREMLDGRIACLAVAFEGFEQFDAAELRNRRAVNREKLNGLNAPNRLGGD
jgi:hypothetical protein